MSTYTGVSDFVRGLLDEAHYEGRLIAWRIDGAVYIMVGEKSPYSTAGTLNFMLGQLPGTKDRLSINPADPLGLVYGPNRRTARPIGFNEVIHVQQQEEAA